MSDFSSLSLSEVQAFSQDLKSGCSKCVRGPAQMNNNMENKAVFFKKWPSTGHLDTYLGKSLVRYLNKDAA